MLSGNIEFENGEKPFLFEKIYEVRKIPALGMQKCLHIRIFVSTKEMLCIHIKGERTFVLLFSMFCMLRIAPVKHGWKQNVLYIYIYIYIYI